MTHICVSTLNIIGSDNGLSPSRRQAIIWANGGILLIRNLGTNFSEILSEIYTLSFKKNHLKMSCGKWRPFCLGLNVLKEYDVIWRCVFTVVLSKHETLTKSLHISILLRLLFSFGEEQNRLDIHIPTVTSQFSAEFLIENVATPCQYCRAIFPGTISSDSFVQDATETFQSGC